MERELHGVQKSFILKRCEMALSCLHRLMKYAVFLSDKHRRTIRGDLLVECSPSREAHHFDVVICPSQVDMSDMESKREDWNQVQDQYKSVGLLGDEEEARLIRSFSGNLSAFSCRSSSAFLPFEPFTSMVRSYQGRVRRRIVQLKPHSLQTLFAIP